jgi:chemotaxis protein MotB
MRKTLLIAAAMAGIVAAAGCSKVQKGAGAGAGLGATLGAGIGHYLTGSGGAAGALVGAGVGGIGGAVAAEHYYGDEESEDFEKAAARALELEGDVASKDGTITELQNALATEKAQQRALLKALEETRTELKKLQATDRSDDGVHMDPATKTLTVTFQSEVFFDSGQATLSAKGKQALRSTAQAIRKRFSSASIEVRGHTDSQPIRYSKFRSNRHLSCSRAAEVVHYLVKSEGFEPNQLIATGMGSTQPVGPNTSASGRAKNRRVEIIVRPGAPDGQPTSATALGAL